MPIIRPAAGDYRWLAPIIRGSVKGNAPPIGWSWTPRPEGQPNYYDIKVEGAYDYLGHAPLTGEALRKATTPTRQKGGFDDGKLYPAPAGGYTGESIPLGDPYVPGTPGWAFGRPPEWLDTDRYTPTVPWDSEWGLYLRDLNARERELAYRNPQDPLYLRPIGESQSELNNLAKIFLEYQNNNATANRIAPWQPAPGTPKSRPALPEYIRYQDKYDPVNWDDMNLRGGLPLWYHGWNVKPPSGWAIHPLYGPYRVTPPRPSGGRQPAPKDAHRTQQGAQYAASQEGSLGPAYEAAVRNTAGGRTIGGDAVDDSGSPITRPRRDAAPISDYGGFTRVQGSNLYDEFLRRIANDNRG